MKLSDLQCCPFCGNDEFYIKQYVYGTIRTYEKFDGREADNSEMYETLINKPTTERAYCERCGRFLGSRKTNTLSKYALKAVGART